MPDLDGIIPDRPPEPELQNAFDILEATHKAADAFFDAFTSWRELGGVGPGAPTDSDQDLLRAALVFTTAGLDATVKQLVKDALSKVLLRDKGAMEQFVDTVQKQLRRGAVNVEGQLDAQLLAQVLTHKSPREAMESVLVKNLTANSLQSKDELLRVAAHFAIQAASLCDDLKELRDIFAARNQIVHEMDIDLSAPNRTRRSRRREFMLRSCRMILQTSVNFFKEVQAKLALPEVV